MRAEIRDITALPKGVQAAAAKRETLTFDMGTRDQSVLDQLPDWLVEIINRAEEWQEPKPATKPEPAEAGVDPDDDIPW